MKSKKIKKINPYQFGGMLQNYMGLNNSWNSLWGSNDIFGSEKWQRNRAYNELGTPQPKPGSNTNTPWTLNQGNPNAGIDIDLTALDGWQVNPSNTGSNAPAYPTKPSTIPVAPDTTQSDKLTAGFGQVALTDNISGIFTGLSALNNYQPAQKFNMTKGIKGYQQGGTPLDAYGYITSKFPEVQNQMSRDSFTRMTGDQQRDFINPYAKQIQQQGDQQLNQKLQQGWEVIDTKRNPVYSEVNQEKEMFDEVFRKAASAKQKIFNFNGKLYTTEQAVNPYGKSATSKVTKTKKTGPLGELQLGGMINTTGYTPGTPTMNNPYNIIPGGNITMKNTPFPVMGYGDGGEIQLMQPGMDYTFPSSKSVMEIPASMANPMYSYSQDPDQTTVNPLIPAKEVFKDYRGADMASMAASNFYNAENDKVITNHDKDWDYRKVNGQWQTKRKGANRWISPKGNALAAIEGVFDGKKSTSSGGATKSGGKSLSTYVAPLIKDSSTDKKINLSSSLTQQAFGTGLADMTAGTKIPTSSEVKAKVESFTNPIPKPFADIWGSKNQSQERKQSLAPKFTPNLEDPYGNKNYKYKDISNYDAVDSATRRAINDQIDAEYLPKYIAEISKQKGISYDNADWATKRSIKNEARDKVMGKDAKDFYKKAHIKRIKAATTTGPVAPSKYQYGGVVNTADDYNTTIIDPNNTEEYSAIQTEIGETILLPNGNLVRVKADRLHKNMKDNLVTDIVPINSYVFSNDKKMILTKDKMVKGLKLSDIVMGKPIIEYKENDNTKGLQDIKFIDMFKGAKALTPAKISENIKSKFKLEDEFDYFTERSNKENKEQRYDYFQLLTQLSESKKPASKQTPMFRYGGYTVPKASLGELIYWTTPLGLFGEIAGNRSKKKQERTNAADYAKTQGIYDNYMKQAGFADNTAIAGNIATMMAGMNAPLARTSDYNEEISRTNSAYDRANRLLRNNISQPNYSALNYGSVNPRMDLSSMVANSINQSNASNAQINSQLSGNVLQQNDIINRYITQGQGEYNQALNNRDNTVYNASVEGTGRTFQSVTDKYSNFANRTFDKDMNLHQLQLMQRELAKNAKAKTTGTFQRVADSAGNLALSAFSNGLIGNQQSSVGTPTTLPTTPLNQRSASSMYSSTAMANPTPNANTSDFWKSWINPINGSVGTQNQYTKPATFIPNYNPNPSYPGQQDFWSNILNLRK